MDPAIRFGTLPNGMRYAIMKNTTPKGEVSIRLRIAAGSLHETEAQRGLAHFVEHMAFRGTTRVPDGELFKTLERLGLRAGADTNARTGELDTVYQFDLPNIDEQTIDTGLMMTREIASEITLNPDAFQAERGPVLSEERLRDGPGMRTYIAHNGFLLKGQLAADRAPIGKVDVIQNAPVSQLADFYRAYYRPERAQLIVVGDIDPDAIEAKIRARFADWRPTGTGRADPDFGTPSPRGQEALVHSETGAPQYATVSWITPYDASLDTASRRKRNRIEGIALSILNQRLAQAAQSADAPFLSAGASRGNTSRSARIASLQINYAADRWQRALIEAEKIRRQVLFMAAVTVPPVISAANVSSFSTPRSIVAWRRTSLLLSMATSARKGTAPKGVDSRSRPSSMAISGPGTSESIARMSSTSRCSEPNESFSPS